MKKFVVKIFVILFLLSSNLFADVKPTLLRTVSLTNIVKSPSDYSLFSKISDYGANVEISGTF